MNIDFDSEDISKIRRIARQEITRAINAFLSEFNKQLDKDFQDEITGENGK